MFESILNIFGASSKVVGPASWIYYIGVKFSADSFDREYEEAYKRVMSGEK